MSSLISSHLYTENIYKKLFFVCSYDKSSIILNFLSLISLIRFMMPWKNKRFSRPTENSSRVTNINYQQIFSNQSSSQCSWPSIPMLIIFYLKKLRVCLLVSIICKHSYHNTLCNGVECNYFIEWNRPPYQYNRLIAWVPKGLVNYFCCGMCLR